MRVVWRIFGAMVLALVLVVGAVLLLPKTGWRGSLPII